jgi:putative transposase
VVSEANMPERLGGMAVLLDFLPQARCLSWIWVDQGYQGEKFAKAVKQLINARVEVVKRSQKQGFQVLPRRWVVERTFAWLLQHRRLAVDWEKLPEISENLIHIAMIRLMLKRLAKIPSAS